MADAAIGGDAVRPGHHGHGHLRNPGAVGAHIGALVEIELSSRARIRPVGIERGARVVALLARMVGGHQMLAPVLDPFDRPPQSHRGEADEKILGVELAANPEPAAGIAFLQHHRRRAAAEHARQRVAVAVRHLGRAIQFQHVAVQRRSGRARRASRSVRRCAGRSSGRGRRPHAPRQRPPRHRRNRRAAPAPRSTGRARNCREPRWRPISAPARRPRPKPARRHPRPDRDRSRTPPRSARRHSAAAPARAAAGDRGAAPRRPGRENRSAADRRCPPPSTPRRFPARPAPPRCRRTATRHWHRASARCAYAAGAGSRYRRRRRPARSATAGPPAEPPTGRECGSLSERRGAQASPAHYSRRDRRGSTARVSWDGAAPSR